ncbi:MAG: hypothetical protein ACRDQ4_00975 [Pseudonocardiaceae bacterium]
MSDPAQAGGEGWCWPGLNAGAGWRELRPGEKTLVLFLNPISLAVAMPPLPEGEIALAQFCRLLAQTARDLATASDCGMAITTGDESSHHQPRKPEGTEGCGGRPE